MKCVMCCCCVLCWLMRIVCVGIFLSGLGRKMWCVGMLRSGYWWFVVKFVLIVLCLIVV